MLHRRSLKRLMLISLAMLGLSVSSVNASIVYNVDRMLGAGTSVSGFIETDGTLGTLITDNIKDWELTLTAPGLSPSPDTIIPGSATIYGSATSATATQLIFDFTLASDIHYLLFQGGGANNSWCFEIGIHCTNSKSSDYVEQVGRTDPLAEIRWDIPVVFAEVLSVPSPVPVPAAVWLFGTALIGMIGFTRRRKAA